MWNYSVMGIDAPLAKKLKKYAKITAILFMVLGLIGTFFPLVMSEVTLAFISYVMLFMGLMAGWMTWMSNKEDWLGWLKSFLLIIMSLLMIFYPVAGISTLGLLLIIYFLFDAFASMMLALSLRPDKGWIWWMFNSIVSLVLAGIFMVGWPFDSIVLVGLYVGISLFFDGLSLLMVSTKLGSKEDQGVMPSV